MKTALFASLIQGPYRENAKSLMLQLKIEEEQAIDQLLSDLKHSLVVFPMEGSATEEKKEATPREWMLHHLAQNGFLSLKSAPSNPHLILMNSSLDYRLAEAPDLSAAAWKLSRFAYVHFENGKMILRSPKATCHLWVEDPEILTLVYQLREMKSLDELERSPSMQKQWDKIFLMLAKAKIIQACDDNGLTEEEGEARQVQWDFHDLLFHSLSRTGRSEKPIGGTYRFKGIIDPQPAIKPNPYTDKQVITLPVPDVQSLFQNDMPLFAAMESRTSTRAHSIVPLNIHQLGEFLFRVARVRYQYSNEFGDFTSRPYPGGGANYEQEFYLSIHSCSGVERGFYYYDPLKHALCLVKGPCREMHMLLFDAYVATANQCFPPILITIASRFNRFNWKYASMSYAAQLKNIGVVYQTMYLVATAMNIGACALGVGNTDRFCQLAEVDYLEEGSIGEFILGQKAF